MSRVELLYHVEKLTKLELEQRTDAQLLQIYNLLSSKHNQQSVAHPKSLNVFVPVVEKLERLYVTPVIQINDTRYGGNVEVTPDIACQLRERMQKHQARERQNQTFIDHGTRDHGTISA